MLWALGKCAVASSYSPSTRQSSWLGNTLLGGTTVLLFKLISCSGRGFLTPGMFQLLAPAQPLSSPAHPQKACPSRRPISTRAVSGTSPGRGPVILLLKRLPLSGGGTWFPRPDVEVGGKGCGWAKVTTHPLLTTSSRTLSAGSEQSAWALQQRESQHLQEDRWGGAGAGGGGQIPRWPE